MTQTSEPEALNSKVSSGCFQGSVRVVRRGSGFSGLGLEDHAFSQKVIILARGRRTPFRIHVSTLNTNV